MKQGSFKIICLIVWACITVFPGFTLDDNFVSFETRVLETFNGANDDPYVWKTQASRFASAVRDNNGNVVTTNDGSEDKYPKIGYVDAWPIAAFGNKPADGTRSLGIHGQFDRRGYNWIDLYPVLAGDSSEAPYEIQIPGRVANIDMWIWGANLRYYVEIFLRDYRGVIHTLRIADIAHVGWKNHRVNVPTNIPQARPTLPSYAGLKFVKFRIWTQPVERVDNFYIYVKQLKVLTDVLENLFDGNDLADPDYVDSIWSNN
ncbi:MAG: flagellar filament outer layer protein FlaA [Treponema sp.]|nr:flagellar filament outer layer protein FlaA [Treponema sp.]